MHHEKKILSLLALVKANRNEKKAMDLAFAMTGLKTSRRKGSISIPKSRLPLSFMDAYAYHKYGEGLLRFEDHVESGIRLTSLCQNEM